MRKAGEIELDIALAAKYRLVCSSLYIKDDAIFSLEYTLASIYGYGLAVQRSYCRVNSI